MIHMKRLLASSLVALSIIGAVAAVGTLVYAADKAPTTANLNLAQADVERAKDFLRQGKLAEAKAANDRALKLAPELLDARVLDTVIARRIAEAANPPATATATTTATTTTAEKPEKLTDAQINRIRAYEITSADRTVTGTVDRKVLDEFWKQVVMTDPIASRNVTADDREAFFRAPFVEQITKIRDSRRNEFVDRTTVRSEPVAMTKFAEVNSWVINNCAFQPGCHNMDNSKDAFRIYMRGGNTAPNIYTNLMIMHQYKAKQGFVIDRDKPEESLIVQYGLPPRDAKWKHPENKKVLPRFSGPNDANFKKIVANISALNKFIPENYGLDVSLSAPAAATAPAAEPAK